MSPVSADTPAQPEIFLIYARASDGTIGKDGTMPWHLPADLKHFKRLTMGHPMIMGRRTYESFPAPLPGRRHIVLTRDKGWTGPQAEVVRSRDEALALAKAGETNGAIAIVGGAQVYNLFMDLATRIELTEIQGAFDGDTHMPALGPEWVEAARAHHPAADGRPAHDFVTLRRAR
jgi:dihydrofolate reductase